MNRLHQTSPLSLTPKPLTTDDRSHRPAGLPRGRPAILRRLLCAVGWSTMACWLAFAGSAADPRLTVDYARLASRADLTYTQAVSRSEEGLPVGNGRMGSLVWTEPSRLRFQVNRVDVFATDSSTTDSLGMAKPVSAAALDHCSGCAFVNIDFGGTVFGASNTVQHLSVYDGHVSVQVQGVRTEVFAWPEKDVMVIQIEDRRRPPSALSVNLRALRPPVVQQRHHTATSSASVDGSRLLLTQEFTEREYLCRSAIAISGTGRKAQARQVNESTVQLIAAPGPEPLTVFVASAAAFGRHENITGQARKQLAAAERQGYARLLQANRDWWHRFWSQSFVSLHSSDGVADFLEQNYTYYLYIMGASSRGKYPPKFNGMIWTTEGDTRDWGSQFWWWNMQTLYRAPLAANHLELMQPLFELYSGMYDSLAVAARQQWGSQGIYLPETVSFRGLAPLPEEIAAELQAVLLEKKPLTQVSENFRRYGEHRNVFSSRWQFDYPSAIPPYAFVVHLFSSAAKVAYLYWQRYEYTLDTAWLRQRAYPMLKGVAEFYRHYPNVKLGPDGRYHIHHVNCHESIWGGQDTIEELAAMRGMLALAHRAAEILGVDARLRARWREVLDHLAPYPTNAHPDSISPRQDPHTPLIWEMGLKPWRKDLGGRESCLRPCLHYDLWTLETNDRPMTQIAQATFEAYFRYDLTSEKPISLLGENPIAAAALGRPQDVAGMLAAHLKRPNQGILRNRMTMAEGVQSQTVEHLGVVAYALQLALCQSIPPGPGGEPVIHLFPAWPREWEARFFLLCRRGFLVSSAMQQGSIPLVEIVAQRGGTCRLRNPWPERPVRLVRDGKRAESLRGSLLQFATSKGERLELAPE